jgi:hypothetical protein
VQIKNASPFVAAFMKAFAPTNKGLGHPSFFVPPRLIHIFNFKSSLFIMNVIFSKNNCANVFINLCPNFVFFTKIFNLKNQEV